MSKIDLSLFAAKPSAKAASTPLVEMTPAECRAAAKVVNNARKGSDTQRLVVKFGRACMPIPLGNGQTADALQPKTAKDAEQITSVLQEMITNGDFDAAFAAEQQKQRDNAAEAAAAKAKAEAEAAAAKTESEASEQGESAE